MDVKNKIKYFFSKFSFLKVYKSPFKRPKLKLYVGKVVIGTPYFLPRRWVKSEKKGYKKPIPKKVGFDFVPLGWKTKWSHIDYRFEWGPLWSFVFFKWQIALTFAVPSTSNFWKCWLVYTRDTDKNKNRTLRVKEARDKHPCVWFRGKEKERVCFWDHILKEKYI